MIFSLPDHLPIGMVVSVVGAIFGVLATIVAGIVKLTWMLRGHFAEETHALNKIDELVKDVKLDTTRNCVHHGLIFEKMDIPRSTVAKAEQAAGVGPKL